MKKISRSCTELLDYDVKEFVDAYNSWDEYKREQYIDDMTYVARKVLRSAIYALGWTFNKESKRFEREENDA